MQWHDAAVGGQDTMGLGLVLPCTEDPDETDLEWLAGADVNPARNTAARGRPSGRRCRIPPPARRR